MPKSTRTRTGTSYVTVIPGVSLRARGATDALSEHRSREAGEQALRERAEQLAAEYDAVAHYPKDSQESGLSCVVLRRGTTVSQNRTWPPGQPRTALLALLSCRSWPPPGHG